MRGKAHARKYKHTDWASTKQKTDLPERLDPAFEDVEVRMRLEVSGPDEVTVQGPELFAGREGSDEMQVLVEGLLKIKVFEKGH